MPIFLESSQSFCLCVNDTSARVCEEANLKIVVTGSRVIFLLFVKLSQFLRRDKRLVLKFCLGS